MWKESAPRNFLRLCIVRGGIWKGDIPIVDLEELEEMEASELHAKRLNAEVEVLPKSGENYKSRSEMEQYNLMEEIRDTESTNSRRKSSRLFRGSEGSPPPPQDSIPDAGRVTHRQATYWPDHFWPEIWKDMSKEFQEAREEQLGNRGTKARQFHKIARNLLLDP